MFKGLRARCRGSSGVRATARRDIEKLFRGLHPSGQPLDGASDVVDEVRRLILLRAEDLGHLADEPSAHSSAPAAIPDVQAPACTFPQTTEYCQYSNADQRHRD